MSRTCSKTANSSSLSLAWRPKSASSEPSFTRPCGLTTDSRISRTSASMLRPCWAARTRRARCTSSGRLRTVNMAIFTTSLCIQRMHSINLNAFGKWHYQAHD
ncbi:hypothetical protein ebA3349 [Aromatoleum aromaticum EbN1]|uniref:Uncharacterized protein n=1 Tax=Aromatoleum aromaticum (strain DSM 19018 / LMG 30748 / EbN1) TaxID=76114 RepID=Q5P3U7_AROAE|nr:hypothetical protein ebA3349 [Aromatoleum aromaticum EbN1]